MPIVTKIGEHNRQEVLDHLSLDIIRHVFAFYDLQHDPEHTIMYAVFKNGSLKGYILTYTALELPSVIVECATDAVDSLLRFTPESPFIMHTPTDILPEVIRFFPHAKRYAENWMLVEKKEARLFLSEDTRRLSGPDDASDLAALLTSRKDRLKSTVEKCLELISKQPTYGVFEDDELRSCAGSFIQLPQVWMIGGVYTQPKHRNKGYATQATSAIIQEAFNESEAAALFVRSDNYPAIRVYEKLAYRKIDERVWIDVGAGRKP